MTHYHTAVIGAGAAGMMCAIEAARRGRSVLVVEHTGKPGQKIRISGGGRCNFTNIHTAPGAFLSRNPRFAISALSRYTPADFIARVEAAGIAWHEKTLGQLFCDHSAQQIIDMLLADMAGADATLRTGTTVEGIEKTDTGFELALSSGRVSCDSLVIATGGKSIPKMGATGFAYQMAERFGIPVVAPEPALVPLTFEPSLLERTKPLSGVAVDTTVSHGKTRFAEAMLFTHRGLSGPAILQISSYWRPGDPVTVDMAPGTDLFAEFKAARRQSGKQAVQTALAEILPKRLAQSVAAWLGVEGPLGALSDKKLREIARAVNGWTVKPVGTEGYRTAEVTLGGIDTGALDARTMQARNVPGLYFIGEAVDVTGWLGGYNFQWAWASGWAAGQVA